MKIDLNLEILALEVDEALDVFHTDGDEDARVDAIYEAVEGMFVELGRDIKAEPTAVWIDDWDHVLHVAHESGGRAAAKLAVRLTKHGLEWVQRRNEAIYHSHRLADAAEDALTKIHTGELSDAKGWSAIEDAFAELLRWCSVSKGDEDKADEALTEGLLDSGARGVRQAAKDIYDGEV